MKIKRKIKNKKMVITRQMKELEQSKSKKYKDKPKDRMINNIEKGN
jgi:hypothetical protein